MNRFILIVVICTCCFRTVAQKPEGDSSLYYNDLFSELDAFLDSLTKPRTTLLINVEASNNYLNYATASANALKAKQELTLSPSIGFFHKNGLGVSATGAILNDNGKLNPYQAILSASYDYLKSYKWGAGLSLSHYFTKDSLDFYTSPLKNESSLYATYKGGWLRPILVATYGWGNRTSVEERKKYLNALRLRPGGYTQVSTEETVSDFSLSGSLKHDFYWRDRLGEGTTLRFTPQTTFTAGTQNYGFNQTANSYVLRNNKSSILNTSENTYLDDELNFQPLSLAAILKGELSYRKFFVQPQVVFDYYFPADNGNFTTGFRLNVGVSL